MATFTSKTLIPGQTPIGQNRDGSYIYEEVMSKATTAPKATTPIYTPPTAIAKIPTDGKTNFMPLVTPENARKPNAPVKDTLNFSKRIKNDDSRVIQLRQHFDYLKQNNELFLNDKQTDYIKRFKEKYPDYSSVPDTILYGKVLLSDPKVQEKYGNIGEKTFLNNLASQPKRIGGAIISGIDRSRDIYDNALRDFGGTVNDPTPSVFDKFMAALPAVAGGVVNIPLNVAGEVLNTNPFLKPSNNTTSFTENLGNTFQEGLTKTTDFVGKSPEATADFISQYIPNEWKQDFKDAADRNPDIIPKVQTLLESGVELANVLPFLKVKGPSPAWVDELANKKWVGEDAIQFVKDKTKQGAETLNGYMNKLPAEKIAGRGTLEGVTPTGEAFMLEEKPGILMNTRDAIFNKKPDEELAFRAVSPRQNKATTPKQITEIGRKNLDAMEQLYADARTGRITSDITTMGGGAEAIDEGLTYWGKKIGDLTEGDSVVQVNDIATILKDSLDDPKTKLNKNLRGLAETVVEVLGDDRYVNGISIKELQSVISDIKGQIFADKNNIMALTRETAGKSLSKFLDEIGTRFDDAIENSTGDLAGLKEAKKAYSKYKSVQKDFLNSYLVQERSIKGGLSNLAGTTIGIVELLKNPTPMGIAKSVALKTLLKEIGISKSRGGAYEALIRSFDRQALTRKPLPNANNLRNNSGLADSQVGQRSGPVDVATPKSVTPVVSGPGKSLAVSMENKTIDVKKALEQFEKLTPEEKAKALQGSPRLATLVEIDDSLKVTPQSRFGVEIPEERIVAALKPVIDFIENGKALMDEKQYNEMLGYIEKNMPKGSEGVLGKAFAKSEGIPEPVVEEKAKVTETKELPKKVTDLEEEIGMLDDNKGDRSSFVQKYDGSDEYGTAGDAYDAVKDMDRFEFVDYASLWKDKDGGGMIPKNETANKIIDDIDGFSDKLGISSDDAITLIRDGTGGSRYKENLANFKARYGVAPFQAKKKLAQFKKAWEAGKNPSIDDFLYKSDKAVDFSKPSKEEMAIENSKTPFDDDPVSPLAKKEPTTTETIEEVVTPKETPKTPVDNPMGRYGAGNRGLTELSDATVEWNNLGTEEARAKLLSEFQTEKGKAFLNEIVEKIPKNKDGTITAYRTGKIGGDKAQSYTLSEGLAKTFSNEGTDISIKTFGKADNKDFGTLETSMVKIDPKGIKGYSNFDSEILVDPKFVKVDKTVSKTPQEGKTGSELFKKNTDIDVNDTIKLVYKGTSDRTLGKMNDYTIYKDGTNVGTTDIIDRGDHYTIGNIGLKDYAQRKGIGSDIHKFVITQFDKPFKTDPALSDKMLGMLEKLKNEGYLTSKETPGKYGTKKAYESAKPKSLPLSQKSEVKYSKKDIANKKYNPTEMYKDYTENYMHSDKWKGKSKAIVIDSDSIKKMFNEYDPKNPGLVHEESSNLSKEFFDRAVAENPDAPVIFSAGGPASGKSEGIINGYHGSKNVIFDTVLGDFEAFLRKAKSKIKDGKVKVHAIYTDIDTAKKYNAGRDRSVPESLLESKHKGFRKAMDDLIKSKEYKEGKIAVEIRANKGGSTEQIPTNGIEDFIREHKNRLDIK